MTARWPLAVLVALTASSSLIAQGSSPAVRVAEILEASGDVEISRGLGAPWTPARTGQELIGTDLVRTRASAFARIKFEAGLQWMLRAASQMELRAALAGAANANTIRVRLESGKAVATWTPDRASAARAGSAAPRAVVETPSGQASILGTEWSLNVEEDGRTALVVLTGSVELSNALGAVTVGANEAAEMRVGFPPTLLRIVSAGDRVQWVADYAAQPLRYADASTDTARGDFDLSVADAAAGRTTLAIDRLSRLTATGAASPGVTLALADLLIAAGELDRARRQLEEGRQQHAMDARFDALLARVALFEGRTAESRALASQATVKDPKAIDGWLALGESAHSDGDGRVARQAFQRATAVSPGDARGWFGLGSVETEYEAFVPARRWLNRALAIDPKGPGYRGEMGTVETLANNFGAANREFAQALIDRRDDYVALTGRALLALKQGREPEALDLLLRATLIEPGYARAHVYLGVTYYRLRRHDDAIRALRKASTLDPKDPLPYLMESAIYTDLYEPWQAMAAGRRANELMPNLKSLNQLASTQKGTANLGNSVAFFGMEPWAQHLAQESYYPFWAGSHLFLGDRYTNEYARTSEYYKGLLLDPTVFGGSPLFQTLLPRAGNYFTANSTVGDDADGARAIGTSISANGYLNHGMPVGYAASITGGRGRVDGPEFSETEPLSGSMAIGAALSPRWSVFATHSSARELEHLGVESDDPELDEDYRWSRSGRRTDAGATFRPSPISAFALRAGSSVTEASMPIAGFLPIMTFGSRPAEVQARFTSLLSGRNQISTGLELASEDEEFHAADTMNHALKARREMQSAQVYGSGLYQLRAARIQADLFVGRESVEVLAPFDAPAALTAVILQPRLGVSVPIKSGVLRAAYQHRTRPWAAGSTLGPVATAGIPIDDQFVQRGGNQQRWRTQLDWEWSSRTFTRMFAEHQRVENRVDLNLIENLKFLFGGPGDESADAVAGALTDLRNIGRDASQLNVTALEVLEGDPIAANGRISIMGGTINQVLTRQVSLASQLVWTTSVGTSTLNGEEDPMTEGKALALVPRRMFSIGSTWVSPKRIYLSAQAIYRSKRFENSYYGVERADRDPNAANDEGFDWYRTERPPDWTARLGGSWESRDKLWAIEFAAADLLSKNVNSTYRLTVKVRR